MDNDRKPSAARQIAGMALKHAAKKAGRAMIGAVLKALAATAPVWGPIVLLILLAILVLALLFWLPGAFAEHEGTVGFFTTGYDEWTLEQDERLYEEYLSLTELDVSKQSQPYTPSQYEQASAYQLPWGLLAAVDRVLGDPVFHNNKRNPRPAWIYEQLGPQFSWRTSTVIEVIVTTNEEGEEEVQENTYTVYLLEKAETYDAIHVPVYETVTEQMGNATVTREVVRGVQTEFRPLLENWLVQLIDRYDIPTDETLDIVVELAKTYDPDGQFALLWTMNQMSFNIPPPELIPVYQEAAKRYGVDWEVLAAIHYLETRFSMGGETKSSAGATGPMQFMPATWKAYGVDGDGDGIADITNVYDSIFSAAHYLSKSGYAEDPEKALYAYNHSKTYVRNVLAESKRLAYAVQAFNGAGAILPVIGATVSSPFGYRADPFTGQTKFHDGIDFAAPIGTPVYAPLAGRVIHVGWIGGYGNTIMIDHGGIITLYGHLNSYNVRTGQEVSAGEVIGQVGNSGRSTGPHLHWSAYERAFGKQNAIDPMQIFGRGADSG